MHLSLKSFINYKGVSGSVVRFFIVLTGHEKNISLILEKLIPFLNVATESLVHIHCLFVVIVLIPYSSRAIMRKAVLC